MMEKNMEIREKNIDNLLSKKGFDVQKNEVVVQPFHHVETPIPQPNLTTTQFCHHPIAPTVIILSSTVHPPPAFVYKRCHHFGRETTTVASYQPPRLTPTSHRSYKVKKNIGDLKFLPKIGDVLCVDVEKIGAIVASSMAIDINPCSKQPPRKCMRSLETVDMTTLFHSHGFFK